MPDHETVLAFESDMAAAKVPFYAKRDEIEAWYAQQMYYGQHDGSVDAVKKLAEERNEKLRALAQEFALTFDFISHFYGMEVRHA